MGGTLRCRRLLASGVGGDEDCRRHADADAYGDEEELTHAPPPCLTLAAA
jgi:hypothetical protein